MDKVTIGKDGLIIGTGSDEPTIVIAPVKDNFARMVYHGWRHPGSITVFRANGSIETYNPGDLGYDEVRAEMDNDE